jgi:hypothetical protein
MVPCGDYVHSEGSNTSIFQIKWSHLQDNIRLTFKDMKYIISISIYYSINPSLCTGSLDVEHVKIVI